VNPLTLPWKLIAEIVAALALFAAITFGIHRFLEYEQNIGYQRAVAEYTAKALEAEKAARIKEAADQQRLQEAQNAYAKAQEIIRGLTAANVAAANGLRDTAANINSHLSDFSADALRDLARTYRDILGECTARRDELAAKTESINEEKRKLISAWPK